VDACGTKERWLRKGNAGCTADAGAGAPAGRRSHAPAGTGRPPWRGTTGIIAQSRARGNAHAAPIADGPSRHRRAVIVHDNDMNFGRRVGANWHEAQRAPERRRVPGTVRACRVRGTDCV
jgi:hypothetical protein